MFRYLILVDQFLYIKIQSNAIDVNTRLCGINPTNSLNLLYYYLYFCAITFREIKGQLVAAAVMAVMAVR